jgi:hypothetical protein
MSDFSDQDMHHMTSDDTPSTTTTPPRGRGQDIVIDGKVWKPHYRIAEEDVGCAPKTLTRNLKKKHTRTALINGINYSPVEEAKADLVADAKRPNEPPTRRGRSTTRSGARR